MLVDSLLSLIQTSLKKVVTLPDDSVPVDIEKIGENLTPNMRALRLTMSIADQLLGMGTAASDVVHMSLGITNTFCTRRVHIDVSYTLLTISQDRGVDREPLTVIRTIAPRVTNYQTIQRLQELANNIRDHNLTLDAAERQLDEILASPKRYPAYVSYLAGGGISAGVSILYTGSLPIVALSFAVGMIVSWLVMRLTKIGIPNFFIQVIAAFSVTIFSAGLSWLVNNGYLDMISYINPTLLIIGGIVLLVAGMMIVGAFQDAIDEYYLTAGARILKVVMMTGGIVMGVVMGLYFAKKIGINFVATPDRLTLTSISYQYVGAAIIAAAFALGNHARLLGVLLAGATGVMGYYCVLLALDANFGLVPSYGLAAAAIGLGATLISRLWRIPSMATISAGIVPLVPGLTLYNGLMQVVQNSPGSAEFNIGSELLLRAVLIAITIAAGASFGNIVGRPMRRQIIKLQNRLPRRRLNKKSHAPSVSEDI